MSEVFPERIRAGFRRLAAGAVDLAVVIAIAAGVASVIPQDLGFMSEYGPEDRRNYLLGLALGWGVSLALTSAVHLRASASIGQVVLGMHRVDRRSGDPVRESARLLLVVVWRQVGPALVFLPGPIVGFVFGPSADAASASLLTVVLLALPLAPLVDLAGRVTGTRLAPRRSADL